jgi:hypothetical protein
VGNTCESNNVSLSFGDDDAYGRTIQDALFLSNTILKSSDGAVMPYTGIQAGSWSTSVTNIRLVDMRYANGATNAVAFVGTGAKDLEFGWLLGITVLNNTGSSVSGATVQIQNADGTLVYAGTTNAQGQIPGLFLLTTTLTADTSTDPNGVVTVTKKSFTVTASSGTKQVSQATDLSASSAITLTLP